MCINHERIQNVSVFFLLSWDWRWRGDVVIDPASPVVSFAPPNGANPFARWFLIDLPRRVFIEPLRRSLAHLLSAIQLET